MKKVNVRIAVLIRCSKVHVRVVRSVAGRSAGDNMSKSEFKDVRYRVEMKLENESRIVELPLEEIKRRLAEDWGYAGDDEDV